jgi:hypothetical protein
MHYAMFDERTKPTKPGGGVGSSTSRKPEKKTFGRFLRRFFVCSVLQITPDDRLFWGRFLPVFSLFCEIAFCRIAQDTVQQVTQRAFGPAS